MWDNIEFFINWWIWIPGTFMLLAYSAIYLLEWKHPRLRLMHIHHSWSHWLQGIGYVLANIAGSWVMASYLLTLQNFFPGLLGSISLGYVAQFVVSVLLLDILIYFWHRINHVIHSLWQYHELHHKEKELNIFSTFHFHPKEIAISTSWRIIIIPALGILPESLFIYNALFFTVILFHHSNFKMGYYWDRIVGSVIVTPGLHHIHHSIHLQESNSNYGSVFSFWDRIFTSFTTYRKQVITYGVKSSK